MARIKINPFLLFVLGLVLITVALIGVVLNWRSENKDENTKTGKEAKEELILKAREDQNQFPAEISAAEKIAEMDAILLGQIRDSPADLDLEWLDRFCQYIRDKKSLSLYFDDILERGAKKSIVYIKKTEKRNMAPVTIPHYFLERTKEVISSKESTVKKIRKNGRDWLALAYYTEHEKKEGWENIDGLFLSVFFKQRVKLFQALQDSALKDGKNPDSWLVEKIKTYEAILVDRHLRTLEQMRQTHEKSKDKGAKGGEKTFGADRLEQEINETLIAMGKIYLNIITKKMADIKKLNHYSDLTFQSMAMVYQRQPSAEALSAIRQINLIQRNYLYRMAQLSWHNARAAKKAGKSEEVDDFYFKATQHYLQCISRWGESDRGQHIKKFQKLKREIAVWKNQGKKSSGDERF